MVPTCGTAENTILSRLCWLLRTWKRRTTNLECLVIKCCPFNFQLGAFCPVFLFYLSHVMNLQWAYWAPLHVGWPLADVQSENLVAMHQQLLFTNSPIIFPPWPLWLLLSLLTPAIRAASLCQQLKFVRSLPGLRQGIPPWGARLCFKQLYFVLTDLLNMSLELSCVPQSFKESILILWPKSHQWLITITDQLDLFPC